MWPLCANGWKEVEALAAWLEYDQKTYETAKKRLIETLMPIGFHHLTSSQVPDSATTILY